MKKIRMIIGMALWTATLPAAEVPKIVTDGLDKYIATNDMDAALKVWLAGSALEGDKTTQLQMVGGFAQISSAYGKGLSYDIVEVVEVSPKVNRAYAVLNLEKGPVFIFFDTYNNGKQWLAANFLFNTKANAIFPEKLLSKQPERSR